MKTTAAVLVAAGRPLELADLELPPPAEGQALVELTYSGVCQTQLLEARGLRGPDPWLPHCLGHEGSGVVLETGPGVKRVRAGDRVILSWIKAAGCDASGVVARWGDRKVNAGPVTTFSRHAVVSENRLTPISPSVPMAEAALLGCAAATGMGAVFRAAAVQPQQTVVVFGAGGVGLCAVRAAVLAGASCVIAVDASQARLQAAMRMGASLCMLAGETDVVQAIAREFPRGVDVAVEATGRIEVMGQALEVVRSQGGAAVIVGNAPFGARLVIDPKQLNQGKRLVGTWGGDARPDDDFPRYCQWLLSGELSLAPLLENIYPLSAVNQALDDLETQRAVRPLLDMRRTG